jgi:hypothetical protein
MQPTTPLLLSGKNMSNANVIIHTTADGNVCVTIPTGEKSIEQVQLSDIPNGVQSFIVSRDALPLQHNDFFDAWEQTDGVITVNFSKAQEITKARLRLEREPLLTAQDVAFQRALETGADTSLIVAEKQRLRDITNLVDSCLTLEELKALHP